MWLCQYLYKTPTTARSYFVAQNGLVLNIPQIGYSAHYCMGHVSDTAVTVLVVRVSYMGGSTWGHQMQVPPPSSQNDIGNISQDHKFLLKRKLFCCWGERDGGRKAGLQIPVLWASKQCTHPIIHPTHNHSYMKPCLLVVLQKLCLRYCPLWLQ